MQSKDPRLYDKLATKKMIKKYAIIMLCLAPILIVLNFTLFKDLSSTLRIILDVVVMLGLLFVADGIIKSIQEKKQNSHDTKEDAEK